MITVREALLLGLDNLLDGYLIKNRLSNGEGGFCAQGAILKSKALPRYYAWYDPANTLRLAIEKLSEQVGGPPPKGCAYRIVEFNNDPLTTKRDVIRIFVETILEIAPPVAKDEIAVSSQEEETRELVAV